MTAALAATELETRYPGIVTPAHFHAPAYDVTLGPIVADVCAQANYGPDPEQRLGLDVIFGLDERRKSAAFEFAAIACRQNLKTGLFKQTAIGWLFVTDERLVVWSAHLFDTAREAFRDLVELIDGSDVLRKRVKNVSTAHGSESIETTTGGRLIFKARTGGGGRGLSGRKVILDEAFALQPAHMGALLPVLSAQPDPQVLYGSSAGLATSKVLQGLVKRGRAGLSPRLGYMEYCGPDPADVCERGENCDHALGTPGCACDQPRYWILGNPALGRRIDEETIRAEREALPAEEFGRERMGWHDAPADGTQVIDPIRWALSADTRTPIIGAPAMAFDVRPGNVAAAISIVGRLAPAAVLDERDLLRMELAYHAKGTDWLVRQLAESARDSKPVAVVYDPSGPAGAFEKALLEFRWRRTDARSTQFVKVASVEDPVPAGKTRLVPITSREYGQSCGAVDAGIRNDKLRHFDQLPMNEAVEGARTTPMLGDLWKWSRKDSSVDISPLISATLAYHGFAVYGTAKPAPAPWAASV